MSGTTEIAPAKKPGFFLALTLGPDGEPDEAACAFIGAHLLLWAGVMFNTVMAKNFPILDFATAEGGLVSIYTAFVTARSRWR
jgi:hypothetical protein